MGVNKQVFASTSERKNYYKLSRTWGDKYRLYHNLPFLNLFNTENLIDFSNLKLATIDIDDLDKNRLKKTSVDYTLCNEHDEPLVCIEFDGMCEGFNVGTEYHPNYRPGEWRDKITELKLKVAHGSFFPFFVVCSKQFADVTKDIKLTIMDGIIGDVIANRSAKEKIGHGFIPEEVGWTQEGFDSLPSWEQHDIVQDWVVDVEVSAEVENNPIYKQVGQLHNEIGFHSHKTEFIQRPPIPDNVGMKERIRLIDSALYQGTRCTVSSTEYGEIVAEVLLPNFKTPYYRGLGLSEIISELVALDKLRRMIKSKAVKRSLH